LALACFVIFLWGTSFAVTRVAVREIPPSALAFLRFALASLLLWPAAHRRCRGERIARADRFKALGLGVTGVTLYFGFENWGLVYTTASHAALIVATIPLAIALLDAWGRQERPRASLLAGLLLSLAGVALVVGPSRGEARLLGDLLMFGAVAAWVAYTFLARHLTERYSSLLVTQTAMVVGALTLAPLAAAELWLRPVARLPSPAAWTGAAFLGVFCSALGYLLWNAAIPALGVTLSSNLINIIPLVGVITGVAALGEPFTAATAAGGALVLGGVVLASLAPAAAPTSKELSEEFR
jgi:drug/metabolite transporter (DMT)-like permease